MCWMIASTRATFHCGVLSSVAIVAATRKLITSTLTSATRAVSELCDPNALPATGLAVVVARAGGICSSSISGDRGVDPSSFFNALPL